MLGGARVERSSLTASRTCRSPRSRWTTARARAASASVSRTRRVGGCRGNRSSWAGGAPSMSRARTASPPMPSASTWWKTMTSAPRSSARPVTMTAAHGGRFSGRRVPTACIATSCSAASSAGSGHRTSRTCRSTVNSGSSTHIGRPHSGGVRTSLRRSRGTARTRSASAWCTAVGSSGRSRTSSAPTCHGTDPRSTASSSRSSGRVRSISASTCMSSSPGRRFV